uniref:Nucleobindin 2 n=1 Tax=Tetraodon nigroviridis TaxID=99883 RepID=H3CBP9_TETNG
MHYKRYLTEVERILKQDPHFRAKLKNATIDDLMAGKLSKELDSVCHDVRSKLDELKREELNRLRTLLKAKHAIAQEKGHAVDHQVVLKQFAYLNLVNSEKFDVDDLDRLIAGVNQHVEQLDESRRQEYKRYQMMKEHERREYLRALSQEQRQQEEERRQEARRKQADHPRINHPGSEDQLKEVWEETDGLDPDDFDPKTFFKLHDTNGDGFLDQAEMEALFTKELKKVYAEDTDDNAEQTELERTRMRNHLLAEVDANKDRLVSLSEFLESTQILPERGVTSDQKPLFSEEELREFEQRLAEENSALSRKAEELQKALLALQRQQLQQAVEEMEKVKGQSFSPQSTTLRGRSRQRQPAALLDGEHRHHLGLRRRKRPLPSARKQHQLPPGALQQREHPGERREHVPRGQHLLPPGAAGLNLWEEPPLLPLTPADTP